MKYITFDKETTLHLIPYLCLIKITDVYIQFGFLFYHITFTIKSNTENELNLFTPDIAINSLQITFKILTICIGFLFSNYRNRRFFFFYR